MSDHLPAKHKLGERAFYLIHERATTFSEQELQEFALLLGEIYKGGNRQPNKIFGQYQKKNKENLDSDAIMRYILAVWFNEELYDMSRSTALRKLIKIFYSTEVNCKPLASQLESFKAMTLLLALN